MINMSKIKEKILSLIKDLPEDTTSEEIEDLIDLLYIKKQVLEGLEDFSKRQLKNIYKYYSENSIQYAEHFLEDFYNKLESLREFPKMYGIIPQLKKHNIRKLLFKDYRILYQIDENKELIKVVAILHSKQRLQI